MTTYYIDSTEGDDDNSGQGITKAWRTIGRVNDQSLVPGDCVRFRRGCVWNEYLRHFDSGEEGNRLQFGAYGEGPRPILDCRVEYQPILTLNGSWLLVEDIHVRNAEGFGVRSRGAHNKMRRLEVENVGLGVGLQAEDNWIEHSYIHDLNIVLDTPGGEDDYGAVAVGVKAPDCQIGYNLFVNCIAECSDWQLDGGAVEFNGDVDGARVHHNKAVNCFGFFEAGGFPGHCHDVAVRNNVMVNCRQIGGIHLGGNYATDCKNFFFERNVVVEMETPEMAHPLLWFYQGEPTLETFIMRRNIICASTTEGRSLSNAHGFMHKEDNIYLLNGFELFAFDGTETFLGISNVAVGW